MITILTQKTGNERKSAEKVAISCIYEMWKEKDGIDRICQNPPRTMYRRRRRQGMKRATSKYLQLQTKYKLTVRINTYGE